MNYIESNMTEEYLKQIINWKYSQEYEAYNLPSYEEMKVKGFSIVEPTKWSNYICFIGDNDEVISFLNIVKQENNSIFLGIGIKPSYCGNGLGRIFLQKGIEEVKKRYGNTLITMQVRSWNKRAIKCYENIGFKITKTETEKDYKENVTEFVFMEYEI